MTLDAWCDRLALAYPDPARAAEVALTLAESNAGRRRPRVGDAVNVIRHGFAARLGGRAAGRATRWGDAASVAVVLALLVQAAAAVAVAARTYLAQPPFGLMGMRWPGRYAPFSGARAAHLALATAMVAVAAATAACLGRVGATRVFSALAAAGALAGLVIEGSAVHGLAFRLGADAFVLVVGLAVVAAVLCTGAVARAAAVVPSVAWVFAAQAAFGGAFVAVAVHQTYTLPGWYESLVALPTVALATAALAVGVVALVVSRRTPALAGGAALVLLAALPVAWPIDQFSGTHDGRAYAVLAVLPVVALGLLARRRRTEEPA